MNNLITKVTFEDVKKEVINRQKRFGTKKSPDQCKNAIFKGINFNEMILLLNYWPKCSECNQYLELEIEFKDFEEISQTIIYILYNNLLNERIRKNETNNNNN